MKHLKNILKTVLFILIVCVGMCFFGELLRQKKLYNVPGESVTTWLDEFYDLEENSIDVIFLGSSQSFCTINPTRMFHNSGVVSYVLSSSAQDIYATKAYLEEALKTQTPKVVMLEARVLIRETLTAETWNRVAYDNLNPSVTKYKNLLKSIREDESLLSYVFPLLRYHDNWGNVTYKSWDYVMGRLEKNEGLMGHYPRYAITKVSLDKYYEEVPDYALEERIINAVKEMKKICDENNIEFFIWKAPTPIWRYDYTVAIEELANDLDTQFLDLNQMDLGIQAKTDFYDATHLNDTGAIKVSDFFSEWLPEHYSLPDQRNNVAYSYYEEAYRKYMKDKLINTTDIVKYCSALQDEKYTVFLCVNDGMSTPEEEYVEALKKLGLEKIKAAAGIKSYIAVIDNSMVVFEEWSKEALQLEFENDSVSAQITSMGYEAGDNGSVIIHGVEYIVPKQRGLGIVVYDKTLGCVVDSVTFDIKMEAKAYRK